MCMCSLNNKGKEEKACKQKLCNQLVNELWSIFPKETFTHHTIVKFDITWSLILNLGQNQEWVQCPENSMTSTHLQIYSSPFWKHSKPHNHHPAKIHEDHLENVRMLVCRQLVHMPSYLKWCAVNRVTSHSCQGPWQKFTSRHNITRAIFHT